VIAVTRSVARVGSVRELAVSADGSAVRILVRALINEADITHHKTLITDFEGVLVDAHPPPGLVIKLAGEVATNVANQAKASAKRHRGPADRAPAQASLVDQRDTS